MLLWQLKKSYKEASNGYTKKGYTETITHQEKGMHTKITTIPSFPLSA